MLVPKKIGRSVEQGWNTRCTASGIRFDRSDSGVCGRGRGHHIVAQGYSRGGLARWSGRGARAGPEFAEVQTVFVRRTDAYMSSALLAFLQIAGPETELRVAAE